MKRRRVLPFPSGLLGDVELDLLGGGDGGFLGLCLSVCRREDAEGNGDAGFKVQVDGYRAQRGSKILAVVDLQQKIGYGKISCLFARRIEEK